MEKEDDGQRVTHHLTAASIKGNDKGRSFASVCSAGAGAGFGYKTEGVIQPSTVPPTKPACLPVIPTPHAHRPPRPQRPRPRPRRVNTQQPCAAKFRASPPSPRPLFPVPRVLTFATSDGTVFQGCQHYMQTYIAAIADCQSPQCRLSAFHPPSCRSPGCNRVCICYFPLFHLSTYDSRAHNPLSLFLNRSMAPISSVPPPLPRASAPSVLEVLNTSNVKKRNKSK